MGSVGVLAVQGDFIEHVHVLRRLGRPSQEVRLPEDLDKVDALIIPGGESTTIGKLADRFGLTEVIRERTLAGMPLWGTCAGMIFMAKDLGANRQSMLQLMDIAVERNAFGAQLDSFRDRFANQRVWRRALSRRVHTRPDYRARGRGRRRSCRTDRWANRRGGTGKPAGNRLSPGAYGRPPVPRVLCGQDRLMPIVTGNRSHG